MLKKTHGSKAGCGPTWVNPSLGKHAKLHRGTKRLQLSEKVRATCLQAGPRQTSFELPTSRLRKSSSRTRASTEMSGAEMLERTGALENQAEQSWTFHEVTSMNEMNGVASDALAHQRKSFAQRSNDRGFTGHQRQSHGHLQEYQQGVRKEVQIHQVASSEEVESLRHELSQEDRIIRICVRHCRSGASESSSEIMQLGQERDHLNVHGRNLETRKVSMSQRGSFS